MKSEYCIIREQNTAPDEKGSTTANARPRLNKLSTFSVAGLKPAGADIWRILEWRQNSQSKNARHTHRHEWSGVDNKSTRMKQYVDQIAVKDNNIIIKNIILIIIIIINFNNLIINNNNYYYNY